MRKKVFKIIGYVLGGVSLIIGIWLVRLLVLDVRLPNGEATGEEVVFVDSEGAVVEKNIGTNTSTETGGNPAASEEALTAKKIFVTDGVRHSIPLDEIIRGGPPRDGIPSIDDPKFVSIDEAKEWLEDNEPGIAVSLGGTDRFYPFQILVWHEIVNDTIPTPNGVEGNGQRVLITYCPLCFSGIVFDPLVQDERVEFGTSGRLWQSNLVMYDRKTESLWSQVLGEAIVGELTGTRLKVLPSDMVRFGEWRAKFSGGEVLSKKTGALRIYGVDPYGDYYTTSGTYFSVSNKDDRLAEKDFVLGIVINGKAKAYWPPAIKEAGEIEDEFQGKTIIVRYEADIDAVRLFERKPDPSNSSGQAVLERINPFGNFWFSWAAAHPETELYK